MLQGHALFTRQAGSTIPCPLVDFDGGFNAFFAAAYGLADGETVESHFGTAFDPFLNDQNFVLSVLSLEELGATGNKGLAGLTGNPVLANGIAGLATSATAQATVQRFLLWQMRNYTIEPFGETAQQVFARVSALRDSLDGPQFDDQGIVNSDPRNIAVPDSFINLIPTDVRGITFSRTPQMVSPAVNPTCSVHCCTLLVCVPVLLFYAVVIKCNLAMLGHTACHVTWCQEALQHRPVLAMVAINSISTTTLTCLFGTAEHQHLDLGQPQWCWSFLP